MLLTFDQYADLGGKIEDDEIYARYAYRAEGILKAMTHGRISETDPPNPAVQYAMLELIDAIHAEASNGANGRQIAGVSNDGMSVSYATGQAGSSAVRYAEIARQYLQFETDANGTLLLYAGVDA